MNDIRNEMKKFTDIIRRKTGNKNGAVMNAAIFRMRCLGFVNFKTLAIKAGPINI